jgi:hypothetical protein
MNVIVKGQIGVVRTVTGVGCIEFGPGSAALLRNQQGGVLGTIVLGDGYSLAIDGRTVERKAMARSARRERIETERALRIRASQRAALLRWSRPLPRRPTPSSAAGGGGRTASA